jgi:hypothetical protein
MSSRLRVEEEAFLVVWLVVLVFGSWWLLRGNYNERLRTTTKNHEPRTLFPSSNLSPFTHHPLLSYLPRLHTPKQQI